MLEALSASEARRTVSLDAPRIRDDGESAPTVETVPTRGARLRHGRGPDDGGRSPGLDEREWLVLKLRFGSGMNQYEIGQQLGVSQMQISRIMRKALRKLLEAVQDDELARRPWTRPASFVPEGLGYVRIGMKRPAAQGSARGMA